MAKPNGKPASQPSAAPPWELPKHGLRLGGVTRKVSYPLPALLRYADASGIDVLNPPTSEGAAAIVDWLLGTSARARADNLQLFLWAGLTVDEPALTKEQVANWIMPSRVPQILNICLSAWAAAHREGEDDSPFVATVVPVANEAEAEKAIVA